MRMFLMVLTVFVFVGCGRSEDRTTGESSLHFITFGPGVSGLVSKVKSKTLTACLSGHNSADRQQWVEKIQTSMMKWIDPLRKMTNDSLATEVVVLDGRGRCNTDVVIAPNTHSNTSIGSYPTVRMSPEGYFASFNVLLHEFGHAFALSDTYQNGTSGNCKPGQPQAVMCNTSFSSPQGDDVTGIQEIFKRTFPRDTPNSGGGIVSEKLDVKISIAFGKQVSGDVYEVYAGLSGKDRSNSALLSYCYARCDLETSWKKMTKSQSAAESSIYSAGTVNLVDGLKFQVRVDSGTKQKKSAFEIQAI